MTIPPPFDAPLVPGEVALVGAGPGAPELITVAAARLLGDCDVVVHDALVPPAVLELAAPAAERIFAGKRGGRPSADQRDICDTLIRLARTGRRVVRLKGGDPLIFGRGGEEARALAAAGVRLRIVPGVTAASAAAAVAGTPLTDRAVNASVGLFTGREAAEESRIDWQAVVRAFPVLVFYMAASTLPAVARRLIAAGMSPSTPILLVHAAGWPQEAIAEGTLDRAAAGELTAASPSIAIVGDVVARRTPWREPVR